MTLFGQTLDGQQLFGVISLLAVLALWIVSLNRERGFQRWLKERQRRQAEEKAVRTPPPPDDQVGPRGPWG